MEYSAHIRIDDEGNKIVQTVREHCEAVAEYAADAMKSANLYHAGFLAGLLHDMGKAQKSFSDYIEKASSGENVRRGSVIHTFQGCRYVLELNHKNDQTLSQDAIADEIIAYAVGAHHGLFDCVGSLQKEHGFRHRMTEEGTGYQEARRSFLGVEQEEHFLDELLQHSRSELLEVFGNVRKMALEGLENYRSFSKLEENECTLRMRNDFYFYLGLTARLLLSSVIEGDRRDTAHFMNGTVYPVFDIYNQNRRMFWEQQLQYMEEKLQRFPSDTPIQQARKEISDICRSAATGEKGVYRLNVPTGAGKTLSSLRYALAHAARHGMNRIIFTAPLLSIIDQNAAIIRSFLKDDSIVLEHHSNISDELKDNGRNERKKDSSTVLEYPSKTSVDPEDNGRNERKKDGSEPNRQDKLERQELLAESWNAPVIITSMVQLLQTFFSGRKPCIRRFQALCNSVIVIDEVQTVPGNMLSLFNLTVNYLSQICGTTFILCSATQPYFEGTDHPLLRTPSDIVPFSEKLWRPFRRTEIKEAPARRLEEMPDFVLREAQDTHSLLVICNKKAEAEYLFQSVEEAGERCFHLSASMCMAHRKKVLSDIMAAIEESRCGGPTVICVTTQVIEAGVDISFGKVIRFAAGMDSIVQAAGRCNRNGEEAGRAAVLIVNCLGENLRKLKDIEDGKKAMQDLLITYADNPESFDQDLSSDKSIKYYYKSLYKGMPGGHQDFPVRSKGRSLLSMLSTNEGYIDDPCGDYRNFGLNQAFSEAGKEFKVFGEDTTDVVIPFEEGENLICELGRKCEAGRADAAYMADWLKRIKPYTVSLYRYQKESIENKAGFYELGGVLILQAEFYSDKTGIVNDNGEHGAFLEV